MTTNATEKQAPSSGKQAIEEAIAVTLFGIINCQDLRQKHRVLAKTTERSKRVIILAEAREKSLRLDLKDHLRLYAAVGATEDDLRKFADALDIINDIVTFNDKSEACE